ncbi:MAG: glycine--tRNA ligase [Candidatus Aenigmatarchaeota archaeon]
MPTLETIEQLAKRRGFFYPSGEIYGGFAGFYEYGHLGTLMKRKIENIWRKFFLKQENFFEIDPSNIMTERVFEASGHLKSFVDPIVKCKKCGTVHRADHIMEEFLKERFEGLTPEQLTEIIKKHNVRCSKCKGELQEVGVLNMMFPLEIGAERDLKGYLRPETAQGVYINFLRQFELLRKKLPIGLAIIGRAYRNEISPRQLITRMREFSQAELQIFFNPDNLDKHEKFDEIKNYKLIICPIKGKIKEVKCSDMKLPKFYVYHMAKVQQFFLNILKIPKDKFRLKELSEEEKAFYNKLHWDIEFNLDSLGWKEIGGIHYRTDHDLSGHEKVSKQSQKIFYDNKKFIPHVLELSFGIDRILYGMLDLFYTKRKDKVILKLPFSIAPITVGVFPLVNKDGLDKKAKEVYEKLKDWFDVFYDDSGSIGRMYARADEIGIPLCITIDYDTKKDNTVTIRDRDTTKQERIKIDKLVDTICKRF